MKTSLYSVYDKTARAYSAPMAALNHTTAIRAFRGQVNHKDANNVLNSTPKDFALYWVGEFDTDSGIINGDSELDGAEPFLICEATELHADHQKKEA